MALSHLHDNVSLDNKYTSNNIVCKNFGFGSNENLMHGFGGMQNEMHGLMSGFGNTQIGMSTSNPGNMVCRSYTYNTTVDRNGNKHVEKKFVNQT